MMYWKGLPCTAMLRPKYPRHSRMTSLEMHHQLTVVCISHSTVVASEERLEQPVLVPRSLLPLVWLRLTDPLVGDCISTTP